MAFLNAPVELVVVHPGGLSARVWNRLAAYLPARTPLRVLELEGINAYWMAGQPGDAAVTVDQLAARLMAELGANGSERVLMGWGAGGVVAHALAARLAETPRRVIVLDGAAPGAWSAPGERELRRRFAMFLGARRGRSLDAGEDAALEQVLEAAREAGVVREGTPFSTVERLFEQHARGVRRDHRLTQTYTPGDVPLTVVRAASGSRELGWDAETLVSSGNHYSMLTDPAAIAHLAMLLRRWLAPLAIAA